MSNETASETDIAHC